MFEVPEAKRVKRSDLFDQDADEQSIPSEDASPEGRQHANNNIGEGNSLSYGFEYDFVPPSAPPTAPAADDEQDQSYEFRLFATTTKPSKGPSKPAKGEAKTVSTGPRITLVRSPSPASAAFTQEGCFVRPRPQSHYLATPSPTLHAQYSASAISYSTLSTLAHTPWPGTALPWRVSYLPASRLSRSLRRHHHDHQPTQPTQPGATAPDAAARKPKPNKKRRIILRQRLATRAARAAATSQPKPKPVTRTATGEIQLPAEEREKRTARNREKKLKRRQRERDRKAALGAGGGGGDVDVDVDADAEVRKDENQAGNTARG